MPKTLTPADLKKYARIPVTFRRMSEVSGEEKTGTFRWLGREEWLAFVPPQPPGSQTWSPEEYEQRRQEWFDSLAPEARLERQELAADLLYRVVSRTSREPKLTLEEAREMGTDAEEAAYEVLFTSGILRRTAPVAVPAPTPEEEPAAVAA